MRSKVYVCVLCDVVAVRSNQKDRFAIDDLNERVETVLRDSFGTRWLQAWGDEVRVGSKLAYFVLTTLLGARGPNTPRSS